VDRANIAPQIEQGVFCLLNALEVIVLEEGASPVDFILLAVLGSHL
jgi:hypothetical protein